MNKKKFIAILYSAIVVTGLYNLILFLLNKNWTISFWLNYGFIMFAIVMTFVSMMITNSKNNQNEVKGISIISLSFIYLTLTFVVGTTLMFFPSVGHIVSLIVHVVLASIYSLILVPSILNYYSEK